MLAQLDKKYHDRYNLLNKQLKMLKLHKHKIQKTFEECEDINININTTVDNNKSNAVRQLREKTIVDKCQNCVEDSPLIHKIPINLHRTFDRKQYIIDEIMKFGLPQFDTRANEIGKHQRSKVSVDVNNIPLMIIVCTSLSFDTIEQKFEINIRCRDPKIKFKDSCEGKDSKEEKEAIMREVYNDMKNNNTCVYIQIKKTYDANWNNWDDEKIDITICRKMSSCMC